MKFCNYKFVNHKKILVFNDKWRVYRILGFFNIFLYLLKKNSCFIYLPEKSSFLFLTSQWLFFISSQTKIVFYFLPDNRGFYISIFIYHEKRVVFNFSPNNVLFVYFFPDKGYYLLFRDSSGFLISIHDDIHVFYCGIKSVKCSNKDIDMMM